MITYICLKSSRANKDHPRNGPLMVSNNVPMKEYDSMLSPNWGEIRALALYEMTRGPNETPRHLIFAFLLLILFIHSRGKWKFTRWFPKKNTSMFIYCAFVQIFCQRRPFVERPGLFQSSLFPWLWKFWPKKCSDCRRRAAHCDWLPRSKMLSNHFIILTPKMCHQPFFSSSPLVRLRNLNVVTLLVDHHLHAGHHGIRVSARLGAGTGWP